MRGFSVYRVATGKGWIRVIANPFGRVVYIQDAATLKYRKNRDPNIKVNRFLTEKLGDLDDEELMLELL